MDYHEIRYLSILKKYVKKIQANLNVEKIQANSNVGKIQANLNVEKIQANLNVEKIQANLNVEKIQAYLTVEKIQANLNVEKIQANLKVSRTMGTVHEALCVFIIISRSVFVRIRNIPGKSCRENQNILCSIPFFSENRSVYGIM